MKKVLIAIFAAATVFSACIKTEPVVAPQQLQQIAFESPVVAPATKTNVDYTDDGFSVYAWFHTESYAGTGEGESIYINNAPQTLSDGVYTNSDCYWPSNGMLSFFAYSPTDAVDNGLTISDMTNAGSLTMTYTVPTEASAQHDLLCSSWVEDQSKVVTDGVCASVPLLFQHMLSAVEVRFVSTAAASGKYRIYTSRLQNLKSKNTLTCTPSGNNWGTPESVEGLGTYTLVAQGANTEVTSTGFTAPNSFALKPFMLLPQTFNTTTPQLIVSYQLKTPDGAWIGQASKIIHLRTITTAWEPGKRYIYTINFDIDNISFAPVVVEDWTVVESEVN